MKHDSERCERVELLQCGQLELVEPPPALDALVLERARPLLEARRREFENDAEPSRWRSKQGVAVVLGGVRLPPLRP